MQSDTVTWEAFDDRVDDPDGERQFFLRFFSRAQGATHEAPLRPGLAKNYLGEDRLIDLNQCRSTRQEVGDLFPQNGPEVGREWFSVFVNAFGNTLEPHRTG